MSVLFISFPSCASSSNTTTHISRQAAADSSPAPPPHNRYPARRCPDVDAPHVPVLRRAAADFASPVAPRCESPAAQNPAASPARSKSDPLIAAPRSLRVPFESTFLRSSEIFLTLVSATVNLTILI